MKAFHSAQIAIEVPPGHRFPARKYELLLQRLERSELARAAVQIDPAPPVSDEDVLRVHETDYWRRLRQGLLEAKEEREMGFPWSPSLVERARHSAGGTLAAARRAQLDGLADAVL